MYKIFCIEIQLNVLFIVTSLTRIAFRSFRVITGNVSVAFRKQPVVKVELEC